MSNVPYVQRTGQPRNAVSMSRSRREGAVQRKQVGNYIVGKAIGEGTFGKVKLGIHIPTGEKVAVKILEKSKIKDQVRSVYSIFPVSNNPNSSANFVLNPRRDRPTSDVLIEK